MSALLDEGLISKSNMQHRLFLDSSAFLNRTELQQNTIGKGHVDALKTGLMQDDAWVKAHLAAAVKGNAWLPFKKMSVNNEIKFKNLAL